MTRILNTEIVSYFYNHASEDDIKQNKKSIGIIAQDLQTINPHCVLEHTNIEDYKGENESLSSRLQIAEDNIALLHSTLSQIIGIVNNLPK